MIINTDQSLHEALVNIQNQLKTAVTDKTHNFRNFSVATFDASRNSPDSRMVVLRSFSNNWDFEFYTDSRSGKISQIRNQSTIHSLFWDPSIRVQVRITAKAEIHHLDELAIKRWPNVEGEAQKAYTSIKAPGDRIDNPEEAHNWPDSLSNTFFAVVRCNPVYMKILQIRGLEHLSLECSRSNNQEDWTGGWITP